MQPNLSGLSYQQRAVNSVCYRLINHPSCLTFCLSSLGFFWLEISFHNDDPVATCILALTLLHNSDQKTQTRVINILRKWCGKKQTSPLRRQTQGCLNILWSYWQESRNFPLCDVLCEFRLPAYDPVYLKCLSLLQIGLDEKAQRNTPPSMLQGYVAILKDTDEELRIKATNLLKTLKKKDTIDDLCQIWINNSEFAPLIEEIIIEAKYVASAPHALRILTMLLTSNEAVQRELKPEDAYVLINAFDRTNSKLSQQAAEAIKCVNEPSIQDQICNSFINKPDDQLGQILVKAGYSPKLLEDQIVFYFLTEQWDRYDTIDFDQRILKSMYPVLSQEQRTRITRKIQSSGKTDYSPILIYWNDPYSQRPVSILESEILVKILAQKKDFSSLWKNIVGLYPETCLLAMQILMENDWLPETADDLNFYTELAELVKAPICLSSTSLEKSIPLAIPRARINVKGRINDICFNPKQNIIAIGTGKRKVVLWNYTTATTVTVLDGFAHSISKLTYLSDETLIIGERTNRLEPCSIYAWEDGITHKLGYHLGGVTSLLPADNTHFISCGKDKSIALWKTTSNLPISKIDAPTWSRSACISPDYKNMYIFDESLYRVNFQAGKVYRLFAESRDPRINKSVIKCSTYTFDGPEIVIGNNSGQLFRYDDRDHRNTVSLSFIHDYQHPIQEIKCIPNSDVLVICLDNGVIDFRKTSDYASLGSINHPEGRLTSCYISLDGKFMATGTSEFTMILWDLQARKLPELFRQPLSLSKPEALVELKVVIDSDILPVEIKNGLEFTYRLLQHRFLYDIEISDAMYILPGEFDIFVE